MLTMNAQISSQTSIANNCKWQWQKGMQICLEVELTGDDAHDVGFPLF